MTWPIDHIVLASAPVKWEPPKDTDYVVLSLLYDPRERKARIVLEGRDGVGTEVRTCFYWEPSFPEWLAGDYQRIHAMLVPLDWDETDEPTGEVAA